MTLVFLLDHKRICHMTHMLTRHRCFGVRRLLGFSSQFFMLCEIFSLGTVSAYNLLISFLALISL